MMAPMVPKGDNKGSGMKNGGEAGTPWSFAAMKCPNSCVTRIAKSAPVN
jgi:hypothetical protein